MSINPVGVPANLVTAVNVLARPSRSFGFATHVVSAFDFGETLIQVGPPPSLSFQDSTSSVNLATNVQQPASASLALSGGTHSIIGSPATNPTPVQANTPNAALAALGASVFVDANDDPINGLEFYSNPANEQDFATLTALPSGFGAGEFTFEISINPDDSIALGDTSGGANQRNLWSDSTAQPYDNGSWWFEGNFLLDGHNNNTFQNGTFSLQIANGRVRWTFGDGTNAGPGNVFGIQQSSGSVLDGNWHKIACVRRWGSGGTADLELWVDGVLVDSETSNVRTNMATTYWDSWSGYPSNQDGWFFGAEKQAAVGVLSQYEDFKGPIDNVAFYNAARPVSELQQGSHAISPATQGYADHWEFSEQTGSVASSEVAGTNINLSSSPAPLWDTAISANWASRTSVADYAERFENATVVTTNANFPGTNAGQYDDDGIPNTFGPRVEFDQGPFVGGGLIPASVDGGNVLRINYRPNDDSASYGWVTAEWPTMFTQGGSNTEFWVQGKIWPGYHEAMTYANRGTENSPFDAGAKQLILSHRTLKAGGDSSYSATNFELVLQQQNNRPIFRGYNRTASGSFNGRWEDFPTPGTAQTPAGGFAIGGDFNVQTAIDNGGADSTNEQQRRRYGELFSYANAALTTDNIPFIAGRPDPIGGAFHWEYGEWHDFKVHVQITGNNQVRYRWYAARERDNAWTLLHDQTHSVNLYNGNDGYQGLWFTGFRTTGQTERDGVGGWNGETRQVFHSGRDAIEVYQADPPMRPARTAYTLETEMEALSPGSWSGVNPFTMNQNNAAMWDVSTGQGNALSFAQKGYYDPFRRSLVFSGGGHPQGDTEHCTLEFLLSDNTWYRRVDTNQANQNSHSYGSNVFDAESGRHWTWRGRGVTLSRADLNAGTYDLETPNFPAGAQGFYQDGLAAEYWPDRHGIFMYQSGRGHYLYNIADATWTELSQTTINNFHSEAVYNPVTGEMLVYSGNSQGSGTPTVWLWRPSGRQFPPYGGGNVSWTLTNMGNPAIDLGAEFGAITFVDERRGSPGYGDFMAIDMPTGNVWRFGHSNNYTWTNLGAGSANPTTGDTDAWAGIPLPHLGGILVLRGSPTPNFWLYRLEDA